MRTPTPSLSLRQRHVVATAITAIACVSLGMASTMLGGESGNHDVFLLYILSLPWTLATYVVTMIVGITSPIAVAITLVLTTLALWRAATTVLIRRCVTPSVGVTPSIGSPERARLAAQPNAGDESVVTLALS